MAKFQKGDRVMITRTSDYVKKGQEGVIIRDTAFGNWIVNVNGKEHSCSADQLAKI